MAKLICNTKDIPEKEWLEIRRNGLGGSDAAAVAGVSKYATPVLVYMDKLGLYIPEKKQHVQEAAYWGHMHEPTIRAEFTRRVNAERAEQGKQPLRVVHRKAIFAHDEHDFMRTNLDGIVYDPELGKGVFEAKTSHYMLREEWDGEDVPNAYFIQCQHNMAVMGWNYAWLAVLIGGNQFKYYFIPRDEEMIEALIKIESNFWINHIMQRIPPAMSGHDAEKEMLNSQYANSNAAEGYIVTLPNNCIQLVEQVDVLKNIVDELNEEKTRCENEIKATMGDQEIVFAGPHKVSWKTDKNGVKSFRIKIDANSDREKHYEKKRKEIEKQRKNIEKELKELEKQRKNAEKVAEKARKAAEKAEKDALKAAKAALKAEKEMEAITNGN